MMGSAAHTAEPVLRVRWLGRVRYRDALAVQRALWARSPDDHLLLLEHPPVYTLGIRADPAHVLVDPASVGAEIERADRGGDVTYHGPGQLIGYPIFDLRSLHNPSGARLGPVDFVRLMEEALIRLCSEFGVAAGRICGLTGVWCGLPSAVADGSPASEEPQSCSKGLPPAGR